MILNLIFLTLTELIRNRMKQVHPLNTCKYKNVRILKPLNQSSQAKGSISWNSKTKCIRRKLKETSTLKKGIWLQEQGKRRSINLQTWIYQIYTHKYRKALTTPVFACSRIKLWTCKPSNYLKRFTRFPKRRSSKRKF